MTKEQLLNYSNIKNEHSQIEQRLHELEKRPESEVEILRPLREYYSTKLRELAAAQLAIERAIETLEPVERLLIRLRYFDGLEWHKIQAKIHYERTQTHRIHVSALQKLERL